jgi:hypothetical protein
MLETLHLELEVNNMPYIVKADPCMYNDEVQYKVSVNNSEEILFVFDTEIGRYVAAGSEGAVVPEDLEEEIGSRLNTESLKVQRNF